MVSVYDLIIKQYKLTKEEYTRIYNHLILDAIVKLKFDLNFIDKIISRLKFPSKSSRKNFLHCPRQFQFSRILDLRNPKEELTLWDVYGGNTHMVCNKVWLKISFKCLLELTTRKKIRDYIYTKCISFIPKEDQKINLYPYLFYNYSDYEAFRISNIFKTYGKPNSKKYVIPTYRELKVENHENYEIGVIDVIHRLTTDEYAIVDYKMGKPKYYEFEWNPSISLWGADELRKDKQINYDRMDIEFELGSYYNLLLGMDGVYKVIETETGNILEEMEFLNLTKGCILYVRDWINTFKYIPLTFEMTRNIDNIDADIIECINKGKFQLKPRNTCFDFCGYIDTCIQDDIWKINFNQVDPDIRNSLERVFSD